MTSRFHVAIIGSARHAIAEPFAGGLEAHTWAMARALRDRGYEVTIFAGPGSDPALGVHELPVRWPQFSAAARADVSMTAEAWLEEHHAYLTLMLEFSRTRQFDIVHNNCLHHLPVAMASAVPVPMVSTLHTPPTPWLESAIQTGPCPATFVAVSEHTARAWRHRITAQVIRNGVDLDRWPVGPGGGPAIWFGRLVPEKGADLAIRAARMSGLALDIVGPISDRVYFERAVLPELGPDINYVGHLNHAALAERVGAASVSLVTPRWSEPYGLVAAESLACGTPVAGFDCGAVAEVVDPTCSVLVGADDVAGLAEAALRARSLPREHARARARSDCSLTAMIDGYEVLYRQLAGRDTA